MRTSRLRAERASTARPRACPAWAVGALAAVLLNGACAGSQSAPRSALTRVDVHIKRGDSREALGSAADEARIATAATRLNQKLGHSVSVEVDAALTPASRSDFVAETAESIEALGRYFSEGHGVRAPGESSAGPGDPALSEFLHAKLMAVVVRYQASATWPTASFEDATGTLVLAMRETSWRGWFGDDAGGVLEVDAALRAGFLRDLTARFAHVDASRISLGEQEAYFQYVAMARPRESRPDVGARLVAMARFERQVRGTELGQRVEAELGKHVGFMLEEPNQGPNAAAVRSSYAHWIAERFFAMASRERAHLYDALIARSQCASDPCVPFPEVDRVSLALGFFEHPAPADETDFGAFDQALCLYDAVDDKLERRRGCNSVYAFLTANRLRAERLVRALARRARRDLLLAALGNGSAAALLGAMQNDQPLYAQSLRLILDTRALGDRQRVVLGEARRLWATRADLRSIFLRGVVEDYVQTQRGADAFARLPDEYAPIDAELFARFLDEGPRSVELAPLMWPALKNVSTPFEIVAPRLARYLDSRPLAVADTVNGLLRRACVAHDGEGLRVIRVVLQKHAQGGDPDALALALAAHDCRPRQP